jgi:hypothetical protein
MHRSNYFLSKAKTLAVPLSMLLSVSLSVSCASICQAWAQSLPSVSESTPPAFQGKALLVLSDGDQSATAYADGMLDRPAGVSDSLRVISLPLKAKSNIASVAVSNSVLGWPQALTVAADGAHAYVVETHAAPVLGKTKDVVKSLPEGHLLTTIDLTDPSSPKVVDQRPIGLNPWTVNINPAGTHLAIDTHDADANLLIVTLTAGLPGAVKKFQIKDFSGRNAAVNSVCWSPDGHWLALNLNDTELAFAEVKYGSSGDIDTVNAVARIPRVGRQITPGRFTPDGRFYMTTDLNCGKANLDYLTNGRGKFLVLSTPIIAGEKPGKVCSTATGVTPEGFALSLDGKTLASVNMNHCFLPKTAAFKIIPGQKHCSISIARFDPDSRKLTKQATVDFDGLLTRHLCFDASGKYLAAAVYQEAHGPSDKGHLEIFRVESEPKLQVADCKFSISLPRGPHTLSLLK